MHLNHSLRSKPRKANHQKKPKIKENIFIRGANPNTLRLSKYVTLRHRQQKNWVYWTQILLFKEFLICLPEDTILRTILFITHNKSTTLGPFKKLVILILGSLYKTISFTFLNIYWIAAKFIFSYKMKVCLSQFICVRFFFFIIPY